MPLSFVIARYFAYAFAAVATAWLASFMALSAAINAGFVYEASWGPANAREVAEGLARDGVCGQQDVPTAYRYLILNKLCGEPGLRSRNIGRIQRHPAGR